MGGHGIVGRVGGFSDIEIFLDHASRVGEERPVGTDSVAIFVRLTDAVGANRDKPAIAGLNLAMEFKEAFMLPAVFGTEPPAAEDENHRLLSLQFRELAVFGGVVRKLVVGESGPWHNIRSHRESS